MDSLVCKHFLENNIKFPNEVAEDVFFNFGAICATSNIIKINEPFYVYRKHPNSASYNPRRLQKNIKCLPSLIEYIEEKLSSIQDFDFLYKVQKYWMRHVTGTYVLPFVKNDNSFINVEIFNALKERFGKDSSFVLISLMSYFRDRSTIQENNILKDKLNQMTIENQKLNDKLSKIEQILKV